jgi:mannose-1-phosphate guanylyltransferase
MYVVIMAGGGGTRLWPLSSPDRPKPFLPLFTDGTLFQKTVNRLLGPELRLELADITVVAAGQYAALARDQVPGIRLLVEPEGRNTAAAIALATLAIDRPEDDVMIVVPADAHIDPARDDVYREVLRTAAEHLATGSFDIELPLVTLGVQVEHPATTYGYLIPDVATRQEVEGRDAYRLLRFEEKPSIERAEDLVKEPGAAWNAGIFLWQRQAIRAALGRFTGLLQTIGPMTGSPPMLERAYESIQRAVSIDYAVMEGAAQDRQVVMGSMDVGWSDLGSWTALLAAIGARGEGAVVQPGETVTVAADDLVVRRLDGRLGLVVPPERGSMTAAQPIAVLRGAAPDRDRVQALIDRCADVEEGA